MDNKRIIEITNKIKIEEKEKLIEELRNKIEDFNNFYCDDMIYKIDKYDLFK